MQNKHKDKIVEKFNILSPFSSIFNFILSPIKNLINGFKNFFFYCYLICCFIIFGPMVIKIFMSILKGKSISDDDDE